MTVRAQPINLQQPADTSAAYRRCARHLRYVHRGHAIKLQQSLRRLRDDVDARRERRDSAAPASPLTVIFEREVEAALDGPVLRYSNRLWLLKRAGQLGIGRFEACLVIAAVQHRAQSRLVETPSPRRPISIAAGLLAALAAEAALLLGAWIAFS